MYKNCFVCLILLVVSPNKHTKIVFFANKFAYSAENE